ncbi:MAG: Adenine phosphoribosyltransferase [Cytophagales bacterium]|jgi:adenine phosphoribosyltransferase|nr:adenine phosphoribosyltransferase [Bacteroidota bacterium]MBS1980791.1 adenine phosphoribosyltransferase [Bacteroidota bacterium]WHZ08140.1 MAG: Adenine phosphoribosyltransferase [Cytophagales bacterium]
MKKIEELLNPLLRDVHDFPRPGILFKDITPLLGNPPARRKVVGAIAAHYHNQQIGALAAVEARGFIFGSLIAQELNIPFVPIRKSGKLPYKKIKKDYSLEYGAASIEMHEDAFERGCRVLIHDDLLATGGTAAAAGSMVQELGATVAGYSFIINLSFLPGEKVLKEQFQVDPHFLIKF